MTTENESPSDTFRPELLEEFDITAPVCTPSDAAAFAAHVIQTAHRAQWWLVLLDDDGLAASVFPSIEMPRRFGEREAVALARVLGQLLDTTCASLAVLWELPRAREDDEEVLVGPSLLAAALARLGHTLLAQVLVLPNFRTRLFEPALAP